MAQQNDGTAGLVPIKGNIDLSDSMNATSSAQGGRISNGMIFNTSGQHIGIVKLLALSAVVLFGLKIWRK